MKFARSAAIVAALVATAAISACGGQLVLVVGVVGRGTVLFGSRRRSDQYATLPGTTASGREHRHDRVTVRGARDAAEHTRQYRKSPGHLRIPRQNDSPDRLDRVTFWSERLCREVY
ncbi:hypothetical protein [Nocardia sp. NPDC051570]|uniref:hypothetical protein n=1 Tax=Nocardia sp. NPDC051570 TaxID=3364324 RepID=UPI0037BA894A